MRLKSLARLKSTPAICAKVANVDTFDPKLDEASFELNLQAEKVNLYEAYFIFSQGIFKFTQNAQYRHVYRYFNIHCK